MGWIVVYQLPLFLFVVQGPYFGTPLRCNGSSQVLVFKDGHGDLRRGALAPPIVLQPPWQLRHSKILGFVLVEFVGAVLNGHFERVGGASAPGVPKSTKQGTALLSPGHEEEIGKSVGRSGGGQLHGFGPWRHGGGGGGGGKEKEEEEMEHCMGKVGTECGRPGRQRMAMFVWILLFFNR